MPESTPYIMEVGCAIIRRKNQLLIAQRCLDDHWGGYWEFPGGKKECEETLENCLIREVEEELGVAIRPVKLLQQVDHAYPERTLRLFFYLCDWVSGEPGKKECHDFCWTEPVGLRQFKFPPADDGIIEELICNEEKYFQ